MRSACQWLAVMLLVTGCGAAPGERDSRATGNDSMSVGTASPSVTETPVGIASPSAPGVPGEAGSSSATEASVGRMAAAEARAFLSSHPEALVLDVRNPDEWDDQYGHIEGARQIPLPELAARAAEIEGWKDRPVVLVCRSGRRSQTGAELLASLGYRRVFNLEGGMIAWRESEGAGR